MTHIMLDLETMGNKPGCPVLAVGACTFDPNRYAGDGFIGADQEPRDTFIQLATLESGMNLGLTPDASTIEWWMKQSDEARAGLFDGERFPLSSVLRDFFLWVGQRGDVHLWGHGASFDQPILEAAYHAQWRVERLTGLEFPWRFFNHRDTRTLYHLAEEKFLLTADGTDAHWQPERRGTHHKALDDAMHQASCVQHAVRLLGVRF